MYQNPQYIIDSFMAKVWRNVRGQYQFKMVEVHDVRLRRRHVFGWDRFVQRPLDDVTYFSSSRTPWNHISVSFTKSTMVNYCKVWVASRDRQVEICFMYSMDAIQIYPTKKHDGAKIWHHFRSFELILTAKIPSHFCHETIYNYCGLCSISRQMNFILVR